MIDSGGICCEHQSTAGKPAVAHGGVVFQFDNALPRVRACHPADAGKTVLAEIRGLLRPVGPEENLLGVFDLGRWPRLWLGWPFGPQGMLRSSVC